MSVDLTQIKFSISGIRGLCPSQLSPAVAYHITKAYCDTLGVGTILITRDSRKSFSYLLPAITQALRDSGRQYTYLGLLPLPTTQIAVRTLKAAGAIDITASHNPVEYNGLKLLDKQGRFLSHHLVTAIEHTVSDMMSSKPNPTIDTDHKETVDADLAQMVKDTHIKLVSKDAIVGKELTVAVDAVNGAGSFIVCDLLRTLGCKAIQIANDPTADFPREPEPTPANLTWTQEQLAGKQYDLCVVVDPDADRLTLIDEKGRALSEELTLPLIAKELLLRDITSGTFVVNQSTSQMADAVLAKSNIEVVRAAVGEANVVAAIVAKKALFGGEGNGGVIDPQANLGRDSLSGIVRIINLLRKSKKSLSSIVEGLPSFVIVKDKLPLADVSLQELYEQARETFADASSIETIDGLRFSWPDKKWWIHIRPSNTEPIVRIIAEAPTQDELDSLMDRLASPLPTSDAEPQA